MLLKDWGSNNKIPEGILFFNCACVHFQKLVSKTKSNRDDGTCECEINNCTLRV